MASASDDYEILGVTFSETSVEIQFLMESEQSEHVKDMRHRMIRLSEFPEHVAEILEDVAVLLNESEAYRRNPPIKTKRFTEFGSSEEVYE